MPTIDWSKLATLDYWLQGIAGESFGAPFVEVDSFFYWFYLNVFASLIVIGILWKVSRAFIDINHPIQKKIPFWSTNLIWLGIVGLFWFLMREINIGLLGARVWLLVMLAYVLVILYFAVRYFKDFYFIEYAYYKNTLKAKKAKNK